MEADAEALPHPTDSFDARLSSVGVMLHHGTKFADELVRAVTRPGGTSGPNNWTPQGLIGHLLTLARYAPPAAPGASHDPLCGEITSVRQLFGHGSPGWSSAVTRS